MKQLLLFFTLILSQAALFAQVKTAGVNYSAGAPSWTPNVSTGSEFAIDTVAKRLYIWNRKAQFWDMQGQGIDVVSGSTAPAYTPSQTDSKFAINNVNALYYYTGSAWAQINSGASYTAGSGIAISGSNVISNTGDLSSTNEIQQIDTLRVNGANLELSLSQDGQPAKTLAVSSIAPVQAVAAGTGISISGTTTRTITNTAPDQTVTLTGAGINSVTGTYPNFTVTGTEVDGSTTNELQNLSLSGQSLGITSGTGVTLPIVDVVAGTGVTVSKTAGAATVNSSGITALTGDVTASGPGSAAATIANGAVTASKLASMGATSGQVLGYNGSAWGPTSIIRGWDLTGNSATAGSSFLGTTNNTSLRFRTNNVQRMILDSLGRLGIGTNTPDAITRLDVNGVLRNKTFYYLDRASGNFGGYFYIVARESGEASNFGNPIGNGAIEFADFNTSGIIFGTRSTTPIVLATSSLERFRITAAGGFAINATNTASGTTGAQTINRPSGTVNFAAGATSLVVTNNLVTTASIVFAVVRTNDTTAVIKNVVPGAGSFTINLNAAATAETSVGFFVIN